MQFTDFRHGGAFADFTRLYLACDAEEREEFEAFFETEFGTHFLAAWRDWRRRHCFF